MREKMKTFCLIESVRHSFSAFSRKKNFWELSGEFLIKKNQIAKSKPVIQLHLARNSWWIFARERELLLGHTTQHQRVFEGFFELRLTSGIQLTNVWNPRFDPNIQGNL